MSKKEILKDVIYLLMLILAACYFENLINYLIP